MVIRKIIKTKHFRAKQMNPLIKKNKIKNNIQMKNLKLIFILTILLNSVMSKAQIGIGTTSPNASAKLDITSTNKGFLPPRVTLTGTADVATIASPATGLMVYNTATAGTSPSNVTPGIYYYDGSKWQRIINQQPDATIEFDKATPTTSGVTFTPNTPASKDYVYVSTVDNSQWTYNGTAYVTYTPTASTAWNLAGGSSDAGSNKTSGIARAGSVGIGTTSPHASAILDVTSTSKGFLPPRVTLTGTADVATIASPASGLMVYNTATAGTSPNNVIPGYYYWNGAAWTRISNNGSILSSSTVTISATTTAPTTGTRTVDRTFAVDNGATKNITLQLGYAGGTAGSGDYLFSLPTGVTFNTGTGYNPTYTGTFNGAWAPNLIPMNGGIVNGSVFSSSIFAIPYSSTQYRIAIVTVNNSQDFWSSSFFNLGAGSSINATFDIR